MYFFNSNGLPITILPLSPKPPSPSRFSPLEMGGGVFFCGREYAHHTTPTTPHHPPPPIEDSSSSKRPIFFFVIFLFLFSSLPTDLVRP